MRKLCITVGLMLALTSCSKEELNTFEYYPETVEETPEIKKSDSIVGTWKYKNGDIQVFSSDGVYVRVLLDSTGYKRSGKWEKVDKKTYLVDWSDSVKIYENVIFNGNQMTYNDTITVTRY